MSTRRLRRGDTTTSGLAQARLASRVIGMPVSAFETGQFCLASSAIRSNSSSAMPGTFALRSRWLPVMPFARLEGDGRRDLEAVGGVAGLLERERERHREAGRMGRAEEFLGIGAARIRPRIGPSSRPGTRPGRWSRASWCPIRSIRSPCHTVVASLVSAIREPPRRRFPLYGGAAGPLRRGGLPAENAGAHQQQVDLAADAVRRTPS